MGAAKRLSGLSGLAVRGPADVVRFIRAALGPLYGSRAAVVVIGLDGANRVTGLAENRQRWTPRSLAVREMVDLTAELAARAVVLVQLVPNKRGEPSMGDAQSFRMLAVKCAPEGVQILDCVVVSGDRWWSLGKLLAERAAAN
jgi:DNA repair protein RadC